jgi:circadian clock protein KaiC
MTEKSARNSSSRERGGLELLDTGVPGLNDILGGGLPALSFNVIAGDPGSGKTTLAMQMLFANATAKRPALFVTLLGETSLKMLRYQQRFEFFDSARIDADVHLLNLAEEALRGDMDAVLERIIAEVTRLRPGFLVVDSFGSLARARESTPPFGEVERFVHTLALQMTTWEVTSFLIGEYLDGYLETPVFTVADGVIRLSQAVDRNSTVRKIQVLKARGMPQMPGLHTFRMTNAGVQVFPRHVERGEDVTRGERRLSTGIAGLDEMMGGGIPKGDSLVLVGPSGTGKTTFAMQFVVAGLLEGEPAVVVIFEEHPDAYLARAKSYGVDIRAAIRDGKLRLIYLRPLDLSVDETLEEIRRAVEEIGAARVVIDSISGFEVALAPTFREDFRESFYRLIGTLTGLGVTVFSTGVVEENEGLRLTRYQVSFLTDDILSQRYVEIEGELRRAVVVVKMRGSQHSPEFRLYDITATGVLLRNSLRDYDNILGGAPTHTVREPEPTHPGLMDQEVLVLEMLIRSGAATESDLAGQTGLAAGELEPILARLLQLRYVRRDGDRYAAEPRPSRR